MPEIDADILCEDDLRYTAYHEAGHAVVAAVFDFPPSAATILADEDSAGHVIIPDVYDIFAGWEAKGIYHGKSAELIARIMVFMAGAVADVELLGLCPGGDDDDRWQIDLMLDSLLPANAKVPAYAARLRRFTRAIVRRHRHRIEKLAAELLERDTLSGEEVRSIIS